MSKNTFDRLNAGLPHLVFVLVLLAIGSSFSVSNLWSFTERDLARAQGILEGRPIFYGPEATGGGSLPGSLYYYLLALPLSLHLGQHGVWLLCALLMAGACAWVFSYMRNWTGSAAPAFITTAWMLQGGMYRDLRMAMNNSFLPIFSTLAITGVIDAFSRTGKRDNSSWIVACFVCGLGVQVHLSVSFVLLAGFVLQWLAPSLGLTRLKSREFILGLGWFVLPMTPFFVACALSGIGYSIGQPLPDYAGNFEKAPGSLVYLTRLLFLMSPQEAIISWTVRLLSLLPIAVVLGLAVERPAQSTFKAKRVTRVTAVVAGVCFIPAAYLLVNPIGARYIAPWSIATAIWAGFQFDSVRWTRQSRLVYALASIAMVLVSWVLYVLKRPAAAFEIFTAANLHLGLLLPAFGLLAAAVSRTSEDRRRLFPAVGAVIAPVFGLYILGLLDSAGQSMPTQADVRAISSAIRNQTHWNFDQVRRRVFFIYPHVEQGFEAAFRELDDTPFATPQAQKPLPDGYFATLRFNFNGPERTEKFAEWILQAGLPSDLTQEVLNRRLRLGQVQRFGRASLVPYWFADPWKNIGHFQNVGFHYQPEAGLSGLEAAQGREGFVRLRRHSYLFYWNHCPGQQRFCTIGARLNVLPRTDPDTLDLNVELLGFVIAQASPWVVPDSTQAWLSPYIRTDCDQGSSQITLISSLGFQPDLAFRLQGMHYGSHSPLAPFERSLRVACRGKLRKLEVGDKGIYVTDARQGYLLPPNKISSVELDQPSYSQ